MKATDLSARLAAHRGTAGAFSRRLDREGVPYLSFSKATAVEFCELRYHLEYVRRARLSPRPDYFLKGDLLHTAAARLYRGRASGRRVAIERLLAFVGRSEVVDAHQVANAVRLAAENAWDGWDVVSVESLFLLPLPGDLPLLLGVTDLVLSRDGEVAVVDHKTGRKFGAPDPLQLAIYCEHARRAFPGKRVRLFFDQYRWVDDLARIRKPAFQRTEIPAGDCRFADALGRLRAADKSIRALAAGAGPEPSGECYLCPWRHQCPATR